MAVPLTINNSLIKTTASSSMQSAISNNFTVNSGSFKALYICTYSFTNVSSVTFNGASFTQMNALTNNGYNPTCWWVLLAPDEGTYTLTVNYSGGGNLGWLAVCLNGVDQTSAVLDTPAVTTASTGNTANTVAWCGDTSTRDMKLLFAIQGLPTVNFNYDTGFNSFLAFSSRTLATVEDSGAFTTQGGGASIGGAIYDTIDASSSYKFGGDHNWSGSVPTDTISWVFINQTLEDEPFASQIMIF